MAVRTYRRIYVRFVFIFCPEPKIINLRVHRTSLTCSPVKKKKLGIVLMMLESYVCKSSGPGDDGVHVGVRHVQYLGISPPGPLLHVVVARQGDGLLPPLIPQSRRRQIKNYNAE